jgi:hypothetical protein
MCRLCQICDLEAGDGDQDTPLGDIIDRKKTRQLRIWTAVWLRKWFADELRLTGDDQPDRIKCRHNRRTTAFGLKDAHHG